jgi:hypothetical protein
MGEMRHIHSILVGKPKVLRCFGDLRGDDMIILKWGEGAVVPELN